MSRARDLASRTGNILEVLSSPCDGSTITVPSGTYTFPSVTAQQGAPASYTDINGSVLAYKPPAGTKQVKYNFQFSSYWVGAHAINHYKFFIDGAEVTAARHTRSAYYQESRYSFEWIINIGNYSNSSTGHLYDWTSLKTLKMQGRCYGGSNNNDWHGTTYWDGGGGNQFSMPVLTIEAIG